MLELYAIFVWTMHQNLDILPLEKRKLQKNVIIINLSCYSIYVFYVTEGFVIPIEVSIQRFLLVEVDTIQKAFNFCLALEFWLCETSKKSNW